MTHDLERQFNGYSLTTAEITYRLPDFRDVLQIFVWQDYDKAPRFPRLIRFLDYWTHHLDGPLAQVRVAHRGLIGPAELRLVGSEWRVH